MILIDIGNSSTEIAFYENKKIKPFKTLKTLELENFLKQSPFDQNTPLIISSVVPSKNALFGKFPKTILINHTNIPFITLNMDQPDQVGSDRLANAVAAYSQVGGSCLVIDSGTATTFCYIDEKGVYQGGAIIPGFEISSKALHQYTAQIPLIWVSPSNALYGKNTMDAVQIGLFKSAIYTINGFIQSYRQKDPQITVIGTGTALKIFKDKINLDHWEENLVLKGLAICADHV